MKKQGKKGMAPIVNPDKDNAVPEKSSDEEMDEGEFTEGSLSTANSSKKNKNKKKKLGLLASKKENKENSENIEENEAEEKADENATPNEEKVKPKHPKKFILFIGNLPYDVTQEQVGEHFKSVKDGVKEIRLSTHADTGKGKGFAFIELSDSVAYKAALKLNKQKMGERVIRVEYTTPGKADNQKRKKFINNKTKKLLGQKKNMKGKGFNKKKGKEKK